MTAAASPSGPEPVRTIARMRVQAVGPAIKKRVSPARVRTMRPRTYRVLALMSDAALGSAARFALTHGTYVVKAVTSVKDAEVLLREWDPDLALIDLDVESGRGLDLLSRPGLRRHVPLIAVTRNGELDLKLRAFDQGADDILNIPFLPEELVARAQALIRRTYEEGIELIAAVRLGEIEIDILARTVSIGDRRVDLSPLEHGLFWVLASNAGAVVSKQRIEELLWGSALGTSSNVVEQYVRRLRRKLGDAARRPVYIETVRGRGYRFAASG